MDDLAQQSPWRSSPRGDEPKPPFRSPLVFGLAPKRIRWSDKRGRVSYAHRLGTAERGTPRILELIS